MYVSFTNDVQDLAVSAWHWSLLDMVFARYTLMGIANACVC